VDVRTNTVHSPTATPCCDGPRRSAKVQARAHLSRGLRAILAIFGIGKVGPVVQGKRLSKGTSGRPPRVVKFRVTGWP